MAAGATSWAAIGMARRVSPRFIRSRSLVVALLLVTATAATSAPCPRTALIGNVTVVRAVDTIVVGTMPIRLNGLSPPEGDEPGSLEATRAMIELVKGRTLRCELNGERTGNRCLGVCYLEGRNIAAEMVRRGVARDCSRFSCGRYHDAELKAAPAGATIGRAY
jgi:endonuclease YncB( thermonuclease family)